MIMKRVFSFVLAFVMLLSLVPVAIASGGNTLDVSVNGLTVTHGDTMGWQSDDEVLMGSAPNGSSINWQPGNGEIVATLIPGNSNPAGATLTFTNALPTTATLKFTYTLTNTDYYAEFRDFEGNAVPQTFEMELQSGDSFNTIAISADPGCGSAVLTISNISLSTGGDVTATFQPAENGSYTVNGEKVEAEIEKTAAVGTSYAVSATAADGYQFFGWYNGTRYLSYKAEENLMINENCTVYPVFIKNDVAVFGVGEARFQNLTDADAYASSGAVKTIVLMNDGILTGEHTISAGNTLLIPYNDLHSVHTEAISTAYEEGSNWVNVEWVQPTAYRTLTMAPGAKITVKGALNVGGRHSAGPFLTAGTPSGDIGMIQMAENANITVENGGQLYCWGYIYGDGTVTVNYGGATHENFQFSDFRGGNMTVFLAKSFLVFPLSQYYVQNIEVATTFAYGASEYVWGSVYLQGMVLGTAVKFIGNDHLSMFVPGENGTVTKTYDPVTDRLVIDIDGDSSINPMGLELGGIAIDTATFVLPINSNMTIKVNSGNTSLYQSLALLPGVKLTIAENATLTVKSREALKDENGKYVHYTGSNNLIVYDRDQWFSGYEPVIVNGELVGAQPVETKFVYAKNGFARLQPVAYSPTRSYTRTEEDLLDAVVDINGKLITDGFIYTTVDVDLEQYFLYQNVQITGGGASVISSKGTGKLVMNNGAGYDAITHQPSHKNTDMLEFIYLPMSPARLQNADGEYLDTLAAAPGAEYNYCAACGNWYAGNLGTHMIDITWVIDGVGGTQEVCENTQPVFNEGNDPVKAGFEFIGWSTGNDNEPEYTSANLPLAVEDATYFACFREKTTALLGDLNLDGKVNSDDLTALARHVAGIETVNGQALINADVNGDGEVNSDDLTMHARYVAGIITDWSQE